MNEELWPVDPDCPDNSKRYVELRNDSNISKEDQQFLRDYSQSMRFYKEPRTFYTVDGHEIKIGDTLIQHTDSGSTQCTVYATPIPFKPREQKEFADGNWVYIGDRYNHRRIALSCLSSQ